MGRLACGSLFLASLMLTTRVLASEPTPGHVSIYFDNDLFSSLHNDADYTAGLAIALSGTEPVDHWLSVHRGLAFINDMSGIAHLLQHSEESFYSSEGGFIAFTPDNLEMRAPIPDDRPYASLAYVANTQQNLLPGKHIAWITTLSVGLLGTQAISSLQNSIHRAVGTDIPRGWHNQISDGGELTFKYSLVRQSYHDTGLDQLQFTTASGMNIGYLTEAFYGASLRTGSLRSPRWSFNVYTSNYGEKSDITLAPSARLNEFYFIAGTNLKVRAYNAFLQGQFRDSAVTYSAHEIEPLILEGWAGMAWEVSSRLCLGYIVRVQSREVKSGRASGHFRYGEFTVRHTFGD